MPFREDSPAHHPKTQLCEPRRNVHRNGFVARGRTDLGRTMRRSQIQPSLVLPDAIGFHCNRHGPHSWVSNGHRRRLAADQYISTTIASHLSAWRVVRCCRMIARRRPEATDLSHKARLRCAHRGRRQLILLAQKNPSALTSCHFRFCSRPRAAALRRNELVQRCGNHGQHSARYATEHQTALRSFQFCWYCASHANTLWSIHVMSLSHPPNRAHQRGAAHSNQRRSHEIA